jgi:hypothetical protein
VTRNKATGNRCNNGNTVIEVVGVNEDDGEDDAIDVVDDGNNNDECKCDGASSFS